MTPTSKLQVAQLFGEYLDNDHYKAFQVLLMPNCEYTINENAYHSSQEITDLYESNMQAGKKKFDQLQWGKAIISTLTSDCFKVHFTDYLTHNGIAHTYECDQHVFVNDQFKIYKIEHHEIPEKRKALMSFYKQVGLD